MATLVQEILGFRGKISAGATKPTKVEQTLMKIWAEVLEVEQIGINDNFFELGGDSILGTLILARAAQAGVKLSPRQLFEHQTIAALSNVAH